MLSSRSFRYVRPYVSPRLKTPFVTSSHSFHLLRLLQSVRYFNSFVDSLQLFPFIPYILPSFRFNSSLPFGRSFSFNSFLSFVTVFLSFQLSPFIRYFIPFVSTLTSRSLLLPFVSSRSLLAMVQEISYLGDYNKSIQPNYDKINLSPSAEKHDTDRTKSAGNLVKQCQGFAIHRR